MKPISGNCILSYGLLGNECPNHSITALEIVDNKYIVSGDRKGSIIVWRVDKDDKISLTWMFIGHTDCIEFLTKIESDDHLFVSVSKNKEIALWDCSNGHCVKFEKGIPFSHTTLKSYNCDVGSLLLCCGRYPGVHIIDSVTFKKKLSLQSQAHPNWIKSLCAFQHKQADVHVVLGLNASGAVTLWTLDNLTTHNCFNANIVEKIVYETESKLLELHYPLSISICPDKPRFLLVLSRDIAQIYDAASWTLLGKLDCDKENGGFVEGVYLNSNYILLRMGTGENMIYRLNINTMNNTNQFGQITFSANGLIGAPSNQIGCQQVWFDNSSRSISVAVGLNDSSGLRMWSRTLDYDDNKRMVRTNSSIIGDRIDGELGKLWRDMNSVGLKNCYGSKQQRVSVVLCEEDRLFLGMDNGEILSSDLLSAIVDCISSHKTYRIDDDEQEQEERKQHNGHKDGKGYDLVGVHGDGGAVLCLQWEKMSEEQLLWSGGEDFCVRLWGKKNSDKRGWDMLRELHYHSGPVTMMIPLYEAVCSNGGNISKMIESVKDPGDKLCVSIDKTNGFCVLSMLRRGVLVNGKLSSELSCVGWRNGGVVVLCCLDGVVSVWDVMSGYCERREGGQLGRDIVDGCIVIWKRQEGQQYLNKVQMMDYTDMQVVRVISTDVLVLDTESILVNLHKSLPVHSTTPSKSLRPRPPPPHSINPHLKHQRLRHLQLLLSLTLPWNHDPVLDRTATSTLGLLQPPQSRTIYYPALIQQHTKNHTSSGLYGHLTSDNCYYSNQFSTTVSIQLTTYQPCPLALTGQLLAATAVCSVISSLSDLNCQWPPPLSTLSSTSSSNFSSDSMTSIKQVSCLIATSIATGLMPQLLKSTSNTTSQLIMHTLILKYQDRCLEIREGARMLLHAVIDSMATNRMHDLIHGWWWTVQSQGPQGDLNNNGTATQGYSKHHHRPSLVSNDAAIGVDSEGSDDGSSGGINLSLNTTGGNTINKYMVPSHVAVLLLGVIGCHVHDGGLVGEDTSIARGVCSKLMGFMMKNHAHLGASSDASLRWPHWRRAAISLLGAGYVVWEPHLEVASLFHRLLETVAGAKKLLDSWSPGQLLNEDQDAARSARDALVSIATSRPKVFATSLSIEVLRVQTNQASSSSSNSSSISSASNLVTQHTSLSNIHSSPQLTAASSASSNSQSSSTTATSTSSQPVLIAARHEVVNILKLLCERKTREMHDVFPEVMDVLLACLNKLELRQYDLSQLFPPIMLFRIAASHTGSGKVCVGTMHGYVVFYDVKLGKYCTLPGHAGRVTSLVFSPDGKQVASYSMPDNSVCVWQLSSSGLFGMGSNHTARLLTNLKVPPVAIADTVSEEDQVLLLWLEWPEPKSLSLVTSAGLFNRIKL